MTMILLLHIILHCYKYILHNMGHLDHLKVANEIKHLTEWLLLPGGHLVGPPLLGSSNSC